MGISSLFDLARQITPISSISPEQALFEELHQDLAALWDQRADAEVEHGLFEKFWEKIEGWPNQNEISEEITNTIGTKWYLEFWAKCRVMSETQEGFFKLIESSPILAPLLAQARAVCPELKVVFVDSSEVPFGARFEFGTSTIKIDKNKIFGEKIGSFVFELTNVVHRPRFYALNKAAFYGLISEKEWVRGYERVEYEGNSWTAALFKKCAQEEGWPPNLAPTFVYLEDFPTFEETIEYYKEHVADYEKFFREEFEFSWIGRCMGGRLSPSLSQELSIYKKLFELDLLKDDALIKRIRAIIEDRILLLSIVEVEDEDIASKDLEEFAAQLAELPSESQHDLICLNLWRSVH